MDIDTFYTEHWKHIEDERIARYEAMFQWRDGSAAMLAALELQPGSRVLDYGSGPGFMALGMTDLVGSGGRVHGVDVNARFVADATARAEGKDNIEFHHLDGDRVPLDDAAVDRVVCKNVLEYVPDAAATVAEFRRVLEPGGRVLLLDSDWGFVLVQPWGDDATRAFFKAASPAFKEPHIGRKLAGLLGAAGFADVNVEMRASADLTGGSLSVLRNMHSYGATFDTMPRAEADALLASAEAAIESGDYLFCLPQFCVSAVRP